MTNQFQTESMTCFETTKIEQPICKSYADFLSAKRIRDLPTGKSCSPDDVHNLLFDFQRLIVAWAVRRGRAAIFADCGLGKTLMQIEWARITGGKTIIFTPLAVARQTIQEAKKVGVEVKYAHEQNEVHSSIVVTNYERIHKFDPSAFDAVILDESSILKSLDGKTRSLLIDMFSRTQSRLCCTATPAPNDHAELANHSDFLGVMTRSEVMATFFVHDDQHWRLKGHAEDGFWRWLSTWAVSIRKPSDLNCPDGGFILPPINTKQIIVESNFRQQGRLFGSDLSGIQGRIEARRETIQGRVKAAAELVNNSTEQWIVWCGLNSESEQLATAIPDAVEVVGSDSIEEKEDGLIGFVEGKYRVLVTKPSIAGFGMNLQNCHNVVFVGLSDSYEEYYQAVRRCWRFGQKQTVNVFHVNADVEHVVLSNLKRKEKEADKMQTAMVVHMAKSENIEVRENQTMVDTYLRQTTTRDGWTMHLGDCCDVAEEIPDDSIDFSICSPPFASLYTYSNTDRDMGNSKDERVFFEHYRFLLTHWLRITRPGRLAAVHVAQIPAMLSKDGYIGLKDFRGNVVAEHLNAGWIYHGEVCCDKNPQAQAIRTKSKGLMFVQLEKDSTWMRPALADYILLFRKPGENQIPVTPDVTRDQWIEYAHPCWYGIRETNTLNAAEAREEKDERHICPLQLDLIDRAVRLWSNRGETVFSPFAGIGSEGYEAVLNNRKFIGIELKLQYWRTACDNLDKAIKKRDEGVLFKM